MDNKYGNGHNSNRGGSHKTLLLGLCKSDSRYPESMPEGTHFIRFAKVGKVKDGITEWEKKKENELTEKPKKWVHACGRKGFTIDKITKDTYICSLPFIGGNSLTKKILTQPMHNTLGAGASFVCKSLHTRPDF